MCHCHLVTLPHCAFFFFEKIKSSGETCRNIGKHKTKCACIVDADESMRMGLEGVPCRYHEDHIAAKGINSLNHFNLVHKFIPMPQALKIPDAKAAVENESEKLEKIPAWQLKVRNKNKRWSMKQGIKAEKFILTH